MTIEKMLTQQVLEAVKACYGVELTEKDVQLQETRKEFAGDLYPPGYGGPVLSRGIFTLP